MSFFFSLRANFNNKICLNKKKMCSSGSQRFCFLQMVIFYFLVHIFNFAKNLLCFGLSSWILLQSLLYIILLPTITTKHFDRTVYLLVMSVFVEGFCIKVDISSTCNSLECQGTETGCYQWSSPASWVG